MMTWSGVIEKGAVWEGRVQVVGDVVVAAGARLEIRPGTEISFAPRPSWSCAVFRGAKEGYPIESSQRELCDVVVLGTLEARAKEGAPIVFAGQGEAWGGLLFIGGSAGRLHGVFINGGEEAVIQSFDRSRVALRQCRLSGARWGLLARGLSEVEMLGGMIASLETGVLTAEGAVARLNGALIKGSRGGLACEDWSLLRAMGLRLQGLSDYSMIAKHRAWGVLSGVDFAGEAPRFIRLDEARIDA
jgi:hypothetical protein